MRIVGRRARANPTPRRPAAVLGGLLAVALVAMAPGPVAAELAVIETSAPLSEQTDQAIKDAVWKAVERAVRGALAMGLPRVELRGARVFGDMVTVEIVATDSDAAAPDRRRPDPSRDKQSEDLM
jgi:hypothetical protein